ncbi:hypothetical protein DFH28DRAFT_922350 [Melampsora americana]|nr:hypothetical protein DFH28DRAFT_922350 [Melampsora americana]
MSSSSSSTKSLVWSAMATSMRDEDRKPLSIIMSLSNLYDVRVIFLGDEEALQTEEEKNMTKGHDEIAEKIATDGERWAAEHWRRDDMMDLEIEKDYVKKYKRCSIRLYLSCLSFFN